MSISDRFIITKLFLETVYIHNIYNIKNLFIIYLNETLYNILCKIYGMEC